MLTAFLLLSVSWWFFEDFDNQGRSRRDRFSLGLSLLNGSFHSHLQTLPVTSCLDDVITNPFWRPTGGPILGGRADMAPASPQMHLPNASSISLGSNLGGIVEAAGAGWTQIQDNWRDLHLGLLRAKSQKVYMCVFFNFCSEWNFLVLKHPRFLDVLGWWPMI